MILLCIIYQIWRFDYHFLSVYLQVHISSNFRPYCLIWIGWMLPSSFSSLVLQPVQGSGRHNNCFPICSYPAQVPPPKSEHRSSWGHPVHPQPTSVKVFLFFFHRPIHHPSFTLVTFALPFEQRVQTIELMKF